MVAERSCSKRKIKKQSHCWAWSQEKEKLKKFVLLKKMTPLRADRESGFERNENRLDCFMALTVSSLIFSYLTVKPHWPHGEQRSSAPSYRPTFLCPFPWQLFLCCFSQNCLIGEPKETPAMIGWFRYGKKRKTAVECLPLSFIINLFALLLLRWVEVQGAVITVAIQSEIQGICAVELKLDWHLQMQCQSCGWKGQKSSSNVKNRTKNL